ncbi:HlyD family efflux transporter periplasmic adaptor subunit [Pseudochrobactrum kiredjianiae]|uniref:HlyD family efflux transporter periplasmic adaptor subunit n=1 Tax=Pseudochrobactrum kiredjianiae TaxID=386305 RepID=A0ABW3V4G0_9HYPH|nr:HlyD family efflux transporter periplasmic adaptor subunit [Pseudochrobactrum kiredjianiae]MDM7852896.1 HlyD family efflux transporter periplasmic adaptor subunit [Pseudochrobactrum kiredjianiae]
MSQTVEGSDLYHQPSLLPESRRPSIVVWMSFVAVGALLLWAYFAPLEEIAAGNGKIIPSSRAQMIQSLEGGILSELQVQEGDIVEKGQRLAVLDDTRFRASYGELDSKILSLEAAAARLRSQMNGGELIFPESVKGEKDLMDREQRLFDSQRDTLNANLSSLKESFALTSRELKLTEPLVAKGAASEVEVIRLRQQMVELDRKMKELENQFQVTARESYSKTMAELDSQVKLNVGRMDQLARTIITAPVRGIVKDIDVTTVGGVIAPGGTIMEIVPIEEQLVVEARVNPRDIAFIRPGMVAAVKLTAYDYSIYGGLWGKVERISPDTLVDEIDKRIIYYRVYVKTDNSSLKTPDGVEHPIIPGMVASVEFRTGTKTVLQYLVKPLNKMGEALRER